MTTVYRAVTPGTRKAVLVLDSGKKGPHRYVVAEDREGEGYVLLGAIEGELPSEGDRRVIEFRDGGPTGGHWALLKGRG